MRDEEEQSPGVAELWECLLYGLLAESVRQATKPAGRNDGSEEVAEGLWQGDRGLLQQPLFRDVAVPWAETVQASIRALWQLVMPKTPAGLDAWPLRMDQAFGELVLAVPPAAPGCDARFWHSIFPPAEVYRVCASVNTPGLSRNCPPIWRSLHGSPRIRSLSTPSGLVNTSGSKPMPSRCRAPNRNFNTKSNPCIGGLPGRRRCAERGDPELHSCGGGPPCGNQDRLRAVSPREPLRQRRRGDGERRGGRREI